ncbi:MAG: EamA family transporter [Bacteroidetes bacterium]|nr:EamA family transporter [Bacteroidota bacterium]MBU1371390.1 EamA family transporter [Bacteroidota bacterium]MBU1485661.1 EamA family transporter [Bacteroidota bacterium]MBU1761907.1 EamA family transporter [Bacteroidota bacterium]MBU2266935.1 EamA family transporter [Bacteroidota bacterium]
MKSADSFKLTISLFCVSFFWGTTYLAVRIAVQTIPVFYIVGLRHFMAGMILLSYLIINKKLEMPNKGRFFHNLLSAFLMLVLGNGLTAYGELTVSSGLTALLTTLSPLIVMFINLLSGREKMSLKIILGVVLGLLGMVLIFFNSLSQLIDPQYRTGIISILLAISCWSIGTVYAKSGKHEKNNIILDLCIQMLFAGTGLLLIGLISGIPFNISMWKTSNILAVFYLTFFGSIAGYISYLYALSKLPSTSVSVFTYFNVVVALFLGWLILDERITSRLIFATILILAGVLLANYRKKSAAPAVQGMIIEE